VWTKRRLRTVELGWGASGPSPSRWVEAPGLVRGSGAIASDTDAIVQLNFAWRAVEKESSLYRGRVGCTSGRIPAKFMRGQVVGREANARRTRVTRKIGRNGAIAF